MALNKLALIRYKTIDECLKNRFRKWTLEDLIEKVSEAIYEYEGITSGVSKRTIQADIQLMRSDKLGYNAPIIVKEKKFYIYENPDYSITHTSINNTDVEKLKEIVGVLKQFSGFSYFEEMTEMIAKLENKIYKSTHQSKSYIQFEDNKLLKGRAYINPLYQAILNKTALLIEYKSFVAQKSQENIYFPYLLKEYRNRWFLIVKPKKGDTLATMALDRIIEFQTLPKEPFVEYVGEDLEDYYSDLIGITKNKGTKACDIILQINKYNAPYVLTKPLHPSQVLLQEDEKGNIIIKIHVILNFELEREILSFGEHIKVLAPRILKNRIKKRLEAAHHSYLANNTNTEQAEKEV